MCGFNSKESTLQLLGKSPQDSDDGSVVRSRFMESMIVGSCPTILHFFLALDHANIRFISQ